LSVADRLPKCLVLAALVAGLVVLIWQLVGSNGTSKTITVDVKVPDISAIGISGRAAFEVNCAACHELNAAGTDKGPLLVHDIYNPGHHSDGAFFLAARLGVRQHHWPYGDMPPQRQVTEPQVAAIVQYVRKP
jgi:mono/diheme cytochrome c family protein